MTNPPIVSAEQEAREWCNNYAFNGVNYWTLKEYIDGKDIEEYLPLEFAIMAHLAGQAVGRKQGFLEALEEVERVVEEFEADFNKNVFKFITFKDFKDKISNLKGGA